MSRDPRVSVGCAVIARRPCLGPPDQGGRSPDEWLLLKRRGSFEADTWCCPGGWLEYDEYPVRAARREFYEEVGGIEIGRLFFAGLTSDVYEEFQCVTLYFSTQASKGDPVILEPDKCSEMGWFRTDHFPSPLMRSLYNYRGGGKIS